MTTLTRLLASSLLILAFSACSIEEKPVRKGRSTDDGRTTNYTLPDGSTICKCGVLSNCGVHMWQCSDNKEYSCMHNFITTSFKVSKTADNDGSCEGN